MVCRSLLAGVFVVLVFSTRNLSCLDDWQPISPEELKMTADAAHPYDAIILYHEELSDDMQGHSFVYKRVKVLTEKGKRLADVEIEYDAADVHVNDIKARTVAPDGTITVFNDKVYDRTVVKGRGIKYLAKTFTLPNVQVGSIIEWKYSTYWEGLVYAPRWTVQEDLPQKRAKFTFVPMLKSNVTIEGPHGVLDRVYSQPIGLPKNAAIRTTVNNKMELELTDIPAFVEEDYSPPAKVLKMRVNFYYGNNNMAKPADFWKEEGKYWNKEVEKFIGHSSSVAAAANQAIAGANSPEDKIRKIYAAVQKLKNLTYFSSEGAIDELLSRAGKEKRNVDEVLRKNAGYRDELSRLFVAMVRAANIPAYEMRVADRDEVFFQQAIPNAAQLTSEIVIVSLGSKEIFLDPGTPMCPFGLLTWQHTGTQGLRQTPGGGTQLAPTEPPDYKEALSKRLARVTLSEDGDLRGTVTMVWAKQEALVERLEAVRTDDAGRKRDMENEVHSMLPNGSRVDFVSATGWDDPEAQLTATFKVEVPSFASNAGKRTLLPAGFFETRNRQPFAHGERKNPVYFNYPYYAADDVQITFPAGLHVENLPAPASVQTDYAFYRFKCAVNGNALAFTRDFAMGGIAFRQEQYDDLRKFYAGVTSGDAEQVVLTSGAH
ncbi:MAG TPA: DUF3857 domain-containing protein [Candidatus Angelobacter sp.]|nr:DUF3857 domain-containing protein [Candidatus Angelobacter sp.]